MRTSLTIIFCLFCIGCNIIPWNDGEIFYPPRKDVAMVTRSQYISNTSTEVIYEVEIVLLGYYQDSQDYTGLLPKNFDFGTNTTTTKVLAFDTISKKAPPEPYSLLLMLDESGSYEQLDPYNTRSQAINKFLYDNSSPNNFSLGGFSTGGKLIEEPLELNSTIFSDHSSTTEEYLFNLSKRTGGISKLYSAIDQGLNKFSGADINPRKELVVVAHAADGGSTISSSLVIQHAIQNNVRISCIEFGNELNGALASIAEQTNGFHISCKDTDEVSAAFLHLRRLLGQTFHPYRLRLQFTPGKTIQSGDSFTQAINIYDDVYKINYSPVYAFIKIP
jgi:hypothetical protein